MSAAAATADPGIRPLDPERLGLARGARAVVAMSGGVDSAVAAALLVEAGVDVVGITLQLYDDGAARGRPGACCAGSDIRDAAGVAARLGIPHYVLDYEARFRSAVIDDFADAYARGETPIPCVRCNETVKFSDLMEVARDLGAASLVTGHYARRVAGPEGPELHRARDAGRDQSYFLHRTTRAQLDFLRFPLGDAGSKAETRAQAARLGLGVAAKKDSQDICFVPDGRYAALLGKLRPDAMESGEIVDEAGTALGRHDGVGHFTVGQRRGLGIASAEPLFVLRLEPERRRVVVGPRERLVARDVSLRDLNWLGAALPGAGDGLPVAAKLRSAQAPVPARIVADGAGGARLRLDPEAAASAGAAAPGQAAVLYDGDRVLGGGWIARS